VSPLKSEGRDRLLSAPEGRLFLRVVVGIELPTPG